MSGNSLYCLIPLKQIYFEYTLNIIFFYFENYLKGGEWVYDAKAKFFLSGLYKILLTIHIKLYCT